MREFCVTVHRMKFVLASLFSILVFPSIAFAAAPKTFSELAAQLVGLMNLATGALILLGIVVYFWGMSINIVEFENDPEKRKAYLVWGVVVVTVMFSIWGIVKVIQNTIFGTV